jgi:hypothetical protein
MTIPEEVAREWLSSIDGLLVALEEPEVHAAEASLANLIRRKQEAAFDAGVVAEQRYSWHKVGEELKAQDAFDARRRAAIEGEP